MDSLSEELSRLQIQHDDLILRFVGTEPVTPPDEEALAYRFVMIHADSGAEMGQINIKAGYTEHIVLFRGNIGYSVHEGFRGHRYAARSCRLLVPVIERLGLDPVYITCNEDNTASRRTIESLGAEYLGNARVDATSPYLCYHPENARDKRRYRWRPQVEGGPL